MLPQIFEPSAPASHLTGGLGGPPGGSPPWGVGRSDDSLMPHLRKSISASCLVPPSFTFTFTVRCSLFVCHRAAVRRLSGSAWLVAVRGSRPMLSHPHAVGLTSAAVAVRMLRTSPGKSVVGVPQVPRLAASYRLAASAAQHGMPLGQVPGPPGPLGLMPCTIATTRGRASLPLVLLPVRLAVMLTTRDKLRTVVPRAPAQRHGSPPAWPRGWISRMPDSRPEVGFVAWPGKDDARREKSMGRPAGKYYSAMTLPVMSQSCQSSDRSSIWVGIQGMKPYREAAVR